MIILKISSKKQSFYPSMAATESPKQALDTPTSQPANIKVNRGDEVKFIQNKIDS